MTTTPAGSLQSLYTERSGFMSACLSACLKGCLGGGLRRLLGAGERADPLARAGFAPPPHAGSAASTAGTASATHAALPPGPPLLPQPAGLLGSLARRLGLAQPDVQSLEHSYLAMLASQPELHAPSEQERALVLASLRRLDTLLPRLTPPARAALLLSQLDGLNDRQIAAHLAVSVRTAQRYLATAFEACLAALDDQPTRR
ncbi:RNA polymerase subunit sigma [Paraburkholderia sp. MMS20-SJTR3]|uniref:RNA polymerase subunit sigma n=1 Tax=Paraburkholderia sejongensis TaxID=2886946 RepID=A0ABS8K265_9BURK|nr:sigma factor-like helix-turn-helix DNA-binding protein [Paraburkholderia sp. MMS20-SJTR3]MCC8396251.1 RNA polymerase subunit sigma [Paraburkholderia sp. MMS20-SJTR3]